MDSIDDLATLSQLDENILLNELKRRYVEKKIYTYVGDILVSLNPFQQLDIYSKLYSDVYTNSLRSAKPPHIFAVADAAYQAIIGRGSLLPKNQCILISGESGAGKTEATKLLIRQLMELCKGASQVEQQIIQMNPLLEAYGNAQTLMNNNSSRFGRYIQIRFLNGTVVGAKISEYLLEKSRVTRQRTGEENFHIFYYMFAGLPAEKQARLKMTEAETYRYLSDGTACLKTARNRLRMKYDELQTAMQICGFGSQEQEEMFSVLAAILILGNVVIGGEKAGEDAKVDEDDTYLLDACTLLGIDKSEMHGCISCQSTFIRGEMIQRNYTVSQAEDARDAITKTLYGRLFSWIVAKINMLLATGDSMDNVNYQEIGILDIFGFERFDRNSFEQACINLANEQIQFFFNKHIFHLEQEEYKREGIDWTEIVFVDNQSILDLFLGKPIGLLTLLDEESQFPKGSDASFLEKLNARYVNHPVYSCQPGSKNDFTIAHYAGKVTYTVTGWLEKNRDTLPPGVLQMLQCSTNHLLSLIFTGKITRSGSLALTGLTPKRSTKHEALRQAQETKERRLTVGAQFWNSLRTLMERMSASEPVFVRCIKPNSKQLANLFDDECVHTQLLYTGMLETTKIRREGYAIRPTFDEFLERYQKLLFGDIPSTKAESCTRILQKMGVVDGRIGKTKVFMKYWHVDILLDHLQQLCSRVVVVQRLVRGYLGRQKAKLLREAVAEQEALAKEMLQDVKASSIAAYDMQTKLAKEDADFIQRQHEKQLAQLQEEKRQQEEKRLQEHRRLQEEREQQAKAKEVDTFSPIYNQNQTNNQSADSKKQPWKPPTTEEAKDAATMRNESIKWFKDTQLSRLLQSEKGVLPEWFHGIITRKDSEDLLVNKSIGCFLIRVSESRFGYSLSFRAEDKCRHYMIDIRPSGKYIVVGESKVHTNLSELVDYYRKNKLSNWTGNLRNACGQEQGQCDYKDLVDARNNSHNHSKADTKWQMPPDDDVEQTKKRNKLAAAGPPVSESVPLLTTTSNDSEKEAEAAHDSGDDVDDYLKVLPDEIPRARSQRR